MRKCASSPSSLSFLAPALCSPASLASFPLYSNSSSYFSSFCRPVVAVESRVSRLGALLQGLGSAPGSSSRFLPGFVTTATADSHGSERRERRGSTRSRMPVMRGLIAPQNTFLDTIATRFDGTRECFDYGIVFPN